MSGSFELEREQRYVDGLYLRLDELRARAASALARVRRAGPSGSPQNRSERDAFAALHEDRLVQLSAVEERLCFGRLDRRDGQRHYIGRIGLSDEEHEQVLVDWRAPAAQAFYRATPVAPDDVVRRRHIATHRRRVVRLDDELLDAARLTEGDRSTLNGEAALLAALTASRTGRMGDIVATIQAEQDAVIRAPLTGALVVQGGPGTGKTAVALHRAAYLLYTHRERLAREGVLVVGPSPAFLRYISSVLPSLGETGVVLATLPELFPTVPVRGEESEAVAAVKGDLRMAQVLATAVRDRQRVPAAPLHVAVDGAALVVTPSMAARARSRARRSHRPHNLARRLFVRDLLDGLAEQYAAALGSLARLDPDDEAALRVEVASAEDVVAALDALWPALSPSRLLAELYAEPDRLGSAGRGLTAQERALLGRDREAPWTEADVPLLDEAAELLGEDDAAARAAVARAARTHQRDVAYAREALALSGVGGMVSAADVVHRYAGDAPVTTVAERATADRTWTYGHVIVDEAQELSPMAWRMLLRRCPRRSMTLVGDVAQTGAAAGAESWREALDPHLAGRWRLAQLTVNYRTPAEIMGVASAVLPARACDAHAPRSVRSAGARPWVRRIAPPALPDAVVAAVTEELPALDEGRLAVIAPRALVAALAAALRGSGLPEGSVGTGAGAPDARVAVLAARESKGLEFDVVLVVEPARLLAESTRGRNDLYVAMTRPTRRLGLLHTSELPGALAGALAGHG